MVLSARTTSHIATPQHGRGTERRKQDADISKKKINNLPKIDSKHPDAATNTQEIESPLGKPPKERNTLEAK